MRTSLQSPVSSLKQIVPARRADEGNLLVVPPQLRRHPRAGQRPSCPVTGADRRSLPSGERRAESEERRFLSISCSVLCVLRSAFWPFFSTLRRVFTGSEGRHRSAGGSLNFRCFCYSSPSSLCGRKHTRAGRLRQSVVGRSVRRTRTNADERGYLMLVRVHMRLSASIVSAL